MSNFSCSECERPIKGTPKLCVVCQAPAHNLCATESNRVTIHGKFYCKQHAGLFSNVDRRSRRWDRNESEIMPRNDGDDEYMGMGSDDEEDLDDQTLIPNFASTQRSSPIMNPPNPPTLPQSPIQPATFNIGRSPQEVSSEQQQNQALRPQNHYRFSQQNFPERSSQEVQTDGSFTQREHANDSTLQREQIELMISQQIQALNAQWNESFKQLLTHLGRPMHESSKLPDNPRPIPQTQHVQPANVESPNSSFRHQCTSVQARERDAQRRLQQPRNETTVTSQSHYQNPNSNLQIDNEYSWYQQNRERFERAASRFSIHPQTNATIVANQTNSRVQNPSQNAPQHEEEEDEVLSTTSATPMEKIMAQLCINQELTLKRQQENDEREKLRDLPVVNNRGSEWIVFYKAFENSKDKFESHENVVRLQKAIKCEQIKKLGGGNLFSPATYDVTIKELNKRLSDPRELLINNVKKILKMKSPKEHPKDHQALLAFINEVRHLGNLQLKVGNVSTQTDAHQIASIVQMLPEKYATSWHELCAQKEELNEPITFMLLGECLHKKLPVIQQLLYTQELANWNPPSKSSNEKREPKKGHLFNTLDTQKKPWDFKCWIDESDEHLIKDCPTARLLSGKEVMDLAKRLQICVNCGKEPYTRKCTKRAEPQPCRFHPGEKHWAIVCPSRMARNNNTRLNSHQHASNEAANSQNPTHMNLQHNPQQIHQNAPSTSDQSTHNERDVERFFLNRPNGQMNNTLHEFSTFMIVEKSNPTSKHNREVALKFFRPPEDQRLLCTPFQSIVDFNRFDLEIPNNRLCEDNFMLYKCIYSFTFSKYDDTQHRLISTTIIASQVIEFFRRYNELAHKLRRDTFNNYNEKNIQLMSKYVATVLPEIFKQIKDIEESLDEIFPKDTDETSRNPSLLGTGNNYFFNKNLEFSLISQYLPQLFSRSQ